MLPGELVMVEDLQMAHDPRHSRETIRLRCPRGWFSLYAANDGSRCKPLVELVQEGAPTPDGTEAVEWAPADELSSVLSDLIPGLMAK